MKRGDHAVAIAAGMIAAEAGIQKNALLVDRLRAAMRVGRDHWMITDEDERFCASVGAVLLSATDDERDRLGTELRALRDYSALCNGLPIDPLRITMPEDPVGLLGLWKEQPQ